MFRVYYIVCIHKKHVRALNVLLILWINVWNLRYIYISPHENSMIFIRERDAL